MDRYFGRKTASNPDSLDGATLNQLIQQEREYAATAPRVQPTPGAYGWVKDNIVAPAANTLALQPYNAIGNLVNPLSEAAFRMDFMPRADLMKMPEPDYLSPAWFTQNIVGGVSTALVYGGIAKGLSAGSGKLATRLGVEGTQAARFMTKETNALIVGGTLYEGLRDPHEGEKRYANMGGALVGLSIFSAGHKWSTAMSGLKLHGARYATGAVGTSFQQIISTGLATGEMLSPRDITKDAFSGGVMNLVLSPILGYKGFRGRSTKTTSETPGKAPETPVPGEAPGPKVSPDTLPSGKPAPDGAPPPGEPRNIVRTKTEPGTDRIFRPRPGEAQPVEVTQTGQSKMEYMLGDHTQAPFSSFADFRSRGQRYFQTVFNRFNFSKNNGPEIMYPSEKPSYNRAPVETIAEATQSVPDTVLIKRVTVYDGTHPMEPWMRQKTGLPNSRLVGEATSQGELKLYRPEKGPELKETVKHEDAHMHRMSDRKASAAFDAAQGMEKLVVSSKSVNHGSAEPWSILAEGLMSDKPIVVMATAEANPIRSAIWGKSLKERLQKSAESQRTGSYDYYRQLGEYIETVIRPRAIEQLQQIQRQGGEASRQADNILRYLLGQG